MGMARRSPILIVSDRLGTYRTNTTIAPVTMQARSFCSSFDFFTGYSTLVN